MKTIAIVLSLAACAIAVNPGAQIWLEQSGLDYAKNFGLDLLKKDAPNIQLPNITGLQGRHRIGAALYGFEVTEIKIAAVTVQDSDVTATFAPPSDLRLSGNKMSVSLTANYKMWLGEGWAKINKKGTITIVATVDSLASTVAISTLNGKPYATVDSCKINTGKIDITFHGDFIDKILDLFKSAIGDLIQKKLEPSLCGQVTQIIGGTLDPVLQKIPTKIPLADGLSIDISFLDNPQVSGSDMRMDMLGEFFYTGHEKTPIVAKRPADFSHTGTHMVYVDLTDYVIDTAGYAAQIGDILKQSVDANFLNKHKPGLGKYLDTTCEGSICIGSLIPGIGSAYPNSTVSVVIRSIVAPNATISPAGVNLGLGGVIDLLVHDNKTNILSFNVGLKADVNNLTLVNNDTSYDLKGAIVVTAATLRLISNSIPGMDQQQLTDLWDFALSLLINKELDSLLQNGIKIPAIPYVEVYNSEVIFLENTIVFGTDVKYTGGS